MALALLFLYPFVTIVFILYLYYRKEPEIKATSVTVSLSMFLACYMLMLYTPLQAINAIDNTHCQALNWLSLCGIPFPLIMATVFAKMLRVYLIFSDPLSYKKKFFSDPFLFMYILLLVSPSFFVLVIWSSYDPLTLHHLETSQGNYIFVHNRCLSNHTIKWLSILLFYTVILSVALITLAIKTSKIRYQHFTDTKATNAFVYLSNFIAAITLIYFSFFFLQRLSVSSILLCIVFLYLGHGSIVVLCQILLFVPKVYPPLKRSFFKCV